MSGKTDLSFTVYLQFFLRVHLFESVCHSHLLGPFHLIIKNNTSNISIYNIFKAPFEPFNVCLTYAVTRLSP